jgi:hypothetical protein
MLSVIEPKSFLVIISLLFISQPAWCKMSTRSPAAMMALSSSTCFMPLNYPPPIEPVAPLPTIHPLFPPRPLNVPSCFPSLLWLALRASPSPSPLSLSTRPFPTPCSPLSTASHSPAAQLHLWPLIPHIVVAVHVPRAPSSSIRSFTTSFACVYSGLSAQPLASVCSTWLYIDPGLPSLPSLCLVPTLCIASPSSSLSLLPPPSPLSLRFSLLPFPHLFPVPPNFVSSSAPACTLPLLFVAPCINGQYWCPSTPLLPLH